MPILANTTWHSSEALLRIFSYHFVQRRRARRKKHSGTKCKFGSIVLDDCVLSHPTCPFLLFLSCCLSVSLPSVPLFLISSMQLYRAFIFDGAARSQHITRCVYKPMAFVEASSLQSQDSNPCQQCARRALHSNDSIAVMSATWHRYRGRRE